MSDYITTTEGPPFVHTFTPSENAGPWFTYFFGYPRPYPPNRAVSWGEVCDAYRTVHRDEPALFGFLCCLVVWWECRLALKVEN